MFNWLKSCQLQGAFPDLPCSPCPAASTPRHAAMPLPPAPAQCLSAWPLAKGREPITPGHDWVSFSVLIKNHQGGLGCAQIFYQQAEVPREVHSNYHRPPPSCSLGWSPLSSLLICDINKYGIPCAGDEKTKKEKLLDSNELTSSLHSFKNVSKKLYYQI